MSRFRKWFHRSAPARRGPAPRGHSFRPGLERLEDRWVLSSYRPAVTDYVTGGFDQLQVWDTGNDGHLYNRYYDGTWHWADHGTGGFPLADGPAVTVYDDPVSGTHQLQVWVVGRNGHLYNHYFDGTSHWADHDTDGVALTGVPAVTVYDDPASGQHQLQVWIAGLNGRHLYNRYYDGAGTWNWADHGTDGSGLNDPAVTVYDDPFSGQH